MLELFSFSQSQPSTSSLQLRYDKVVIDHDANDELSRLLTQPARLTDIVSVCLGLGFANQAYGMSRGKETEASQKPQTSKF